MKAGSEVVSAWLAATWPAEETLRRDRMTLQQSPGGGRRVQSARLSGDEPPPEAEIAAAEAQMRIWGQRPIFMVASGQDAFDAMLARAGYVPESESIAMAGSVAPLLDIETPRLSTFPLWPPLAVMTEIWQGGGIGPDRVAVMARVRGDRTAILGREADRPAAAAFVARCGTTAVVHALTVRVAHQRRGMGRRVIAAAAQWSASHGCARIATLAEAHNTAARALYASLGMQVCAGYHYRALEDLP